MNRMTIGLFAHVDAGKTTFAEQLLYHTRSIRERGRVDHKDAHLDSHEIERARGITVFADQAAMTYRDTIYDLIDTPGHVDFSPEMERAVRVMDCAIVIVSAVEGVQGHTETVWQLLRKHEVPTLLFINKIDRVGAEAEAVLEEIRTQLSDGVVRIDGQLGIPAAEQDAGVPQFGEALLEQLAERDETLLEAYLEGERSSVYWLQALRERVADGRLFPCASGSALQDIGVTAFLAQLHLLAARRYDAQSPFGARVYKIRHDAAGTRLTYLKLLSGTLKVRDELVYPRMTETSGPSHMSGPSEMSGDDGAAALMREKATRLLRAHGTRLQPVEQAVAGELVAVVGLSAAPAGLGLGSCADRPDYELTPALTSRVAYDSALPAKDVLAAFRLLEAEDPSLNVVWEESLQELHIHVMGTIQLEVLQPLVRERFGYEVTFEEPAILYKETIGGAVIGYGHFEPLRHYAEVHLRLEPGARGSGLTFRSDCHVHELSAAHQRLVEAHLRERDHHGLLTGMPLTDVRVTLLRGAAHHEHTHGGDFREATFRALRQGLEQADNVLLEPVYAFKLRVELDHLGKVLSDIQRAAGCFEPPETSAGHAIVRGTAPVATFMDYGAELAAHTGGKGALQLRLAGYAPCHNAEAVIARRSYRKEADPLYTSSSIFCAKGSGYSVPWDEAERYMHLR
ncbi:TetM/TetW/TetO/TetS family tetracycline resistance ribosomal protection protein [Paenibacillus sp. IB182496]|uniref:TetM/TetW/TetO/TetS family tetracycline resistance ribosomal protection protein n=1 Tax=Paenibacillus sabuli TaxID=2772509 RepID=A0A927GSL0_9BACL|nr:TetM/TetW/TetO/TetS family tetracycline resistance ribosomal protection protein [Paenibacillus sabuli]MBD2846678.1 TetM/TetW/TetO/TetS family tetracycline resistance ribosomal protection protein [Paenibacillus sabuli]